MGKYALHKIAAAAGAGFLSLLTGPLTAQAEAPNVFIGEVAWRGTSKSQADEWVEFLNRGTDPVTLTGWTVEGLLSGGAVLTLPEATILPGRTYLIANYPAGHASSALLAVPDLVTTAVSLPNEGLKLVLKQPDGSVVDTAGDGGKPPAGKSGSASMVRVDQTTWTTADAASGYAPGLPDLGTPGTADMLPTTPEPPITTDSLPPEDTPSEPVLTPPEEPSVIEETPPITTDIPKEEMPVVAEEIPVVSESPPIATRIPVVVHVPPGSVLINEFLADPSEGEDEWVELYNPYVNTLPLAGWHLRDKSGARTPLPDGYLGFSQFLVVRNPLGKLNNGSDALELVGPDGDIVDTVAYGEGTVPKSKKGRAIGRQLDGSWAFAERSTPGEANIFPIALPIETPSGPETSPLEQVGEPTLHAVTQPIVGTFILSELYPNTGGHDVAEEFIEVRNAGDTAADLRGWRLGDRTKTIYVHAGETILGPNEALALPRSLTKIALNNTGDAVRLSAPDKTERDAIVYEKATRKQTYARQADGSWSWADPTPDEENAVPAPPPIVEQLPVPKPKKAAPAPARLSIAESREQEDGARVALKGTVTYVEKKRAYIRDDTSGIRLDASKPFAFAVGDVISVTGTVGRSAGERRVRLMAKDTTRITGHRESAFPVITDLTTVEEADTGRFVAAQAFLLSKSGTSVRVDAEGTEVTAKLEAGAKLTGIQIGAAVRVSGLFYQKDGAPNLLAAHAERAPDEPAPIKTAPLSQSSGGILSFFTRLFRRT